MTFLFIVEKPSRLAYEKGIKWEDGGLAAKQLFDALRAAEIDPASCHFLNLFGDHPDSPESGPLLAEHILHIKGYAAFWGYDIVAMGKKVASHLRRHDVTFREIVHPAARGTIRGKAVYAAHVRAALVGS